MEPYVKSVFLLACGARKEIPLNYLPHVGSPWVMACEKHRGIAMALLIYRNPVEIPHSVTREATTSAEFCEIGCQHLILLA